MGNAARDSQPPRYEEAERAYRLAARLAPKDPRSLVGLGNILYDQKKYFEAAAAYRAATEVAGFYNQRITKEVRRRESFKRALEREQTRRNSGNQNGSTGVHHKIGGEERLFLASARLLGQESAYLGAALIRQGRPAEAEKELKKATKKNLGNAEWWALLGVAQLERGNVRGARRSLLKAVKLDSFNAKYAELLSRTKE